MPKALEEALDRSAEKKGYTGERKDRYVYGYMNKHGYMHGNKVTAKGAALEHRKGKHAAVKAMLEKAS